MNILLVDKIQLGPTRVWGKSSLNGHEWGDNRIFSNMPLKGEEIFKISEKGREEKLSEV